MSLLIASLTIKFDRTDRAEQHAGPALGAFVSVAFYAVLIEVQRSGWADSNASSTPKAFPCVSFYHANHAQSTMVVPGQHIAAGGYD
jgi:hypothetical protein